MYDLGKLKIELQEMYDQVESDRLYYRHKKNGAIEAAACAIKQATIKEIMKLVENIDE